MKNKLSLRDMSISAIFAALIAISAYVSIPLPFSPIPITGQTFAIMLVGLTLTTLQVSLSVSIYILLGIVGLPVFAGGLSGIAVVTGPKGGYIIGFLIGAIIISLIRKMSNNIFRLTLAGFIGGIVVIYICGVIWLSYAAKLPIMKAIMLGAVPYIPLDIIKLVIAVIVAKAINKRLLNTGVT